MHFAVTLGCYFCDALVLRGLLMCTLPRQPSFAILMYRLVDSIHVPPVTVNLGKVHTVQAAICNHCFNNANCMHAHYTLTFMVRLQYLQNR